jgi:hypothetical protein
MSGLTLFGLLGVTAMLVCYALESRSHWFVLGFAVACVWASVYGFLQGAWPFGIVEAIWAIVALRRWRLRRSHQPPVMVLGQDC